MNLPQRFISYAISLLCQFDFTKSYIYNFQSINSCGEGESFPFANDNAGTIRMRANGHAQAMLDYGDSEEPTTPSDDTNSNETSSQRSLHK